MYALFLQTDDCYRVRRLLCVSESFETLKLYLNTLPNTEIYKNIPPDIQGDSIYYRGDFEGYELAIIEKIQKI